jgi:hypothetical protein
MDRKVSAVVGLVFVVSCAKNRIPSAAGTFVQRASDYVEAGNKAAVTQCMRNKGFKFVQVEEKVVGAPIPFIGEPARTKRGYGLAAVYDQQISSANPNVKIYMSLSALEQRDYDTALNGDKQNHPWRKSCNGLGAQAAMNRQRQINEAFSRLRSEFDARADVIAHRRSWSDV